MADRNRHNRKRTVNDEAARYSSTAHPSLEQLMTDQGTGPVPAWGLLA